MKITIVTLFPEFFDRFKEVSIIKRAIGKNLVTLNIVNLRDYSLDKNHRVDDRPIGGGAGLIMRLEPLMAALNDVSTKESHKVLLSAAGKTYDQKKAVEFSKMSDIVLFCGHYEGVDYRFENRVDECVSIGDYILTGGEIGAMLIADSVIRLLEGAISADSTKDESFNDGLLEYPQYTFPIEYEGERVPDILLTGNHEAVQYYRERESLKRTKEFRPDLLKNYPFSKRQLKMLKEIDSGEKSKIEEIALSKGARFIKKDQ